MSEPTKRRAARPHGPRKHARWGVYDETDHCIGEIRERFRGAESWYCTYQGVSVWVPGRIGAAIGYIFAQHRAAQAARETIPSAKPRAATYGDVGAEPEVDPQDEEEVLA